MAKVYTPVNLTFLMRITKKLFDELLPTVAKAAKEVTKVCGPTDTDLGYYQAVYPDVVVKNASVISAKLLSLTKTIATVCSQDPTRTAMALDRPSTELYEDALLDVLDGMLEEADHQLDILHGRIKQPKIFVREPMQKRVRFQTAPSHLKIIKPEDVSIYEPDSHPYADVIKSLSYEKYLVPLEGEIPAFKELDETPLLWIDTEEELDKMIVDLSKEPMIAVDLEHHSMHSYHGVTCLMQISTPTQDYLIDTIKLRPAVPRLASILSNPSILKIMHGSESDNIWLQRDFNIFLVNLFDTFFASKALNLERFSFAHLVERYVGMTIDKQHQLSDWRVRPLPEDMQLYARQDTHYLFYIYEHLRKELAEKSSDAITGVFNRSAHQCLKLFRVEPVGSNDWKVVINGSNVPYNKTELARVKALFDWRGRIAKQEDTSLFALMPNPVIIKLAQASPTSDLTALLKASRYDMELVLKNIDSLQEALNSCSAPKQVNKPPVPESKPEHIIFNDEEHPASVVSFEPAKPVVIATELKSKRAKRGSSSLAGAFGAAPSVKSTLDLAPVLDKLDIVKAEKVAALLHVQHEAEANGEEESVEAVPEVKVERKCATVMKTGEQITEEEILALATEKVNYTFSTARKSDHYQPIEIFDYSTARIEEPQAENGLVEAVLPKSERLVKEFKPVIEGAVFAKTNAGPRITTQPRSGNRNKTFYN